MVLFEFKLKIYVDVREIFQVVYVALVYIKKYIIVSITLFVIYFIILHETNCNSKILFFFPNNDVEIL